MTWSTKYAAGWAMRRAPQEGQNQRRSQLNATSLSRPQSPQCRRNKPYARMPHSSKASNSSFTNCGRSAPLGQRKATRRDCAHAAEEPAAADLRRGHSGARFGQRTCDLGRTAERRTQQDCTRDRAPAFERRRRASNSRDGARAHRRTRHAHRVAGAERVVCGHLAAAAEQRRRGDVAESSARSDPHAT